MAKTKSAGYGFGDMSHGKRAENGEHLSKLKHETHGLKAKPQTSGHIDPHKALHDAAGHDHGSRGPYPTASKGHHKSK